MWMAERRAGLSIAQQTLSRARLLLRARPNQGPLHLWWLGARACPRPRGAGEGLTMVFAAHHHTIVCSTYNAHRHQHQPRSQAPCNHEAWEGLSVAVAEIQHAVGY